MRINKTMCLVARGLEFGPYGFTMRHVGDRNHVTHFVPGRAQSGQPWEPLLEWRPQHLTGHDTEVLTVVLLDSPGGT